MPSFVIDTVTTSYVEVCNAPDIVNITRHGFHVQNFSGSIVWVKLEEPAVSNEYAFGPNALVVFDFVDIIGKVYIKAESEVTGRKVILTIW